MKNIVCQGDERGTTGSAPWRFYIDDVFDYINGIAKAFRDKYSFLLLFMPGSVILKQNKDGCDRGVLQGWNP